MHTVRNVLRTEVHYINGEVVMIAVELSPRRALPRAQTRVLNTAEQTRASLTAFGPTWGCRSSQRRGHQAEVLVACRRQIS